jgi:hypothetical protein
MNIANVLASKGGAVVTICPVAVPRPAPAPMPSAVRIGP